MSCSGCSCNSSTWWIFCVISVVCQNWQNLRSRITKGRLMTIWINMLPLGRLWDTSLVLVKVWKSTLLKTTFFNFDTFELSGESLLKTTDEITEATHSALRIHDERHGYKVNDKGSKAHIKVSTQETSVIFKLGPFAEIFCVIKISWRCSSLDM